jgi:predicted aspartyl protease
MPKETTENTNKINRPTLSQMKGNKNDGLFVNTKIHNTEVHCLIDTGSTMSALHITPHCQFLIVSLV